VNESWHADAHKMEPRFTVAAFFLAPLVLAFAFRRSRDWREAWLPSLLEIPAGIAAGVLFSVSETVLRSARPRSSGSSGPRISACS